MNLKKLLISMVTIIMFSVFVLTQSAVYAHGSGSKWMGIQTLMRDNPKWGYAINDPRYSSGVNIWNIVSYPSGTATNYNNDHDIYCLKEGKGFTLDAGGTKQEYNYWYNMKTEKEEIKKSTYDDTVKNFIGNKIGSENVDQYNAVLAVLDSIYIPNKSTEEEKKELICKFLRSTNGHHNKFEQIVGWAFDMPETTDLSTFATELLEDEQFYKKYDLTEYALTDEEIVAVQQAALWYFTNYGEERNGKADFSYDKTNSTGWLWYTNEEKDADRNNIYKSMNSYKKEGEVPNTGTIGEIKSYQADILYNYIVQTAKANASKYENINATVPVEVAKTKLTYTEDSSNYKIGPIKITENKASNLSYKINFEVKNGEQSISNYTIVDINGTKSNIETLVKEGKDIYISIPKNSISNLNDTKVNITTQYNDTVIKLWVQTANSNEQPLVEIDRQPDSTSVELTIENNKSFDLALRKYITKINGTELAGDNSRIPNIDESMLTNGKTTAAYKHKKDPVEINTGDTVTYKMTIYNEGEKAGRATEVIDQLPTGLEFSSVVSGNFDKKSYDSTTNTLVLERKAGNTTNLPAYQQGNLVNNGSGSETIEIECKVTEKPDATNRKVLTNVAWISKAIDEDNIEIVQEGQDRDSLPANKPDVNKDNMSNYTGHADNKTEDLADREYHYKGQEDDDDFEKLVLLPKAFDLKLVKHISAINGDTAKGKTITNIDTSKLASGEKTTAEYELDKNAVKVKVGDYVTYTFSVYNEGDIDGYVTKLTDNIPLGLQFVQAKEDGKTITIYSYNEQDGLTSEDVEVDKEIYDLVNTNNAFWGIDGAEEGQGVKIDTYDGDRTPSISLNVADYLGGTNQLLKAYDKEQDVNRDGKSGLSSVDVTVVYKVSESAPQEKEIRNEAAITGHSDKEGNDIIDRDSKPEEWPGKDDHNNYEDDEDYDKVIIESQVFDLALRKFIVAVSDDTKIDKNEELRNANGLYTRAPEVDTSKLNTIGEDGKLITTATYNHTKEPIIVKPNDIVVYMLRVYNEGDVNGYASEIIDHLPPHLEFVEGEYNKQYGWEISEDGRTATTRYLENSKIDAAIPIDKETTTEGIQPGFQPYKLHYKEVPIMCRVKEDAKTSEKITNIADITEYLDEDKKPATDRDSQPNNVKLPEDKELPGYKDNEMGSYIPGQQDDDDFEKVIVKIFDLALRKWVTQAIVIENGGQTVTQTGHDAWDDPEAVVKVELHRKKLNQVIVKFKYSIRVYNQGEIAGYAKEVTDYIPEGLKFVAEDNPGWTDEGNNVISTRLLENTLLQPGEFADVEVLLTWINSENNLGVMINTAEISEDYNEYDVPDIDSTPDNKKPGEDDIDDAPVMLSISTGQVRIYFTLGFVILITVAGGVVLIKKFVI